MLTVSLQLRSSSIAHAVWVRLCDTRSQAEEEALELGLSSQSSPFPSHWCWVREGHSSLTRIRLHPGICATFSRETCFHPLGMQVSCHISHYEGRTCGRIEPT